MGTSGFLGDTVPKRDPLLNETEIIERIWRALPARAGKKERSWLRLGVGDDAAAIRAAVRGRDSLGDWVLSSDAFLEGIHFLPQVHSPEDIGYKALARATSDLAAMGTAPRFFLLSLALPASRTGKWLDGFLEGMSQAAREFKMVVIGGDTSRFSSVVINVTVGGRAGAVEGASKNRSISGDGIAGNVLTRSGARPGDLIYVSGTLGAAQLGLELILHGLDGKARTPGIPQGRPWKRLLQPHLRPKIQLALGSWLAGENPLKRQIASAAIDTSDGLSTDLSHICMASGVGARIWAEKIPAVHIPESLRSCGSNFDRMELALHGGEDYQLLFTVPVSAALFLPGRFRGVQLSQIGEIVPQRAKARQLKSHVELVPAKGNPEPLRPRGWDPFTARQLR